MQITPAQMRLTLTKRVRRKTNQRVRPPSFRFHRLPVLGGAPAAACLAYADLVAACTVLCHPDGRRRRCGSNRRRAPRISARLHNLTPSCARTCCHCTQPCAVCHVVDRYPPPSHNHHLGCLGGKIATRPTRERADRRAGTSRPSAARAGCHVSKSSCLIW